MHNGKPANLRKELNELKMDQSLKRWAQCWPLFRLFSPIHRKMAKTTQNPTINEKSVDGVLGIQTLDHRMSGTDESTELWWPWLDKSLML